MFSSECFKRPDSLGGNNLFLSGHVVASTTISSNFASILVPNCNNLFLGSRCDPISSWNAATPTLMPVSGVMCGGNCFGGGVRIFFGIRYWSSYLKSATRVQRAVKILWTHARRNGTTSVKALLRKSAVWGALLVLAANVQRVVCQLDLEVLWRKVAGCKQQLEKNILKN